jgi:hypothetical protein
MSDEVKTQVTQDRVEKMILGWSIEPSPEARLLAAILAQAVVDATERDKHGAPSSDKVSAIEYFRRGGHQYLSELLGLDPEAPIRWIERCKAAKVYSNGPR